MSLYDNSVSLDQLYRDLGNDYLAEGFKCRGDRFGEIVARIIIQQGKKIERLEWEIEKLKQKGENREDYSPLGEK